MNILKRALGLGVLSAVAVGTFFHSKTEHELLSKKMHRKPASIPRTVSFGITEGKDFEEASRKRIISGMRALAKQGVIGLQIGHFIARDSSGQFVSSCDLYDRVAFTFEAEGVATGGERPQITIEGQCRVGQSTDTVAPIWFPVAKLASHALNQSDGEIRFSEPDEIVLLYRNLGREWPADWVLSEVKMFSRKEGKSISLSVIDMYKLAAKSPLTMEW